MANDAQRGSAHGSPTLENLHTETRTFPPLVGFAAHANATAYEYKKANVDTPRVLARGRAAPRVEEALHRDPRLVRRPRGALVPDGTLNACDNAVDRHVREGRGDRVAFHFVGEPGDTETITYADMLERVQTRRQRPAQPRQSARATASRSTCRRSPRPWSRCSRARASAQFTLSSLAASARRACASASTTRRPSSSSRPTAATGAAPTSP